MPRGRKDPGTFVSQKWVACWRQSNMLTAPDYRGPVLAVGIVGEGLVLMAEVLERFAPTYP